MNYSKHRLVNPDRAALEADLVALGVMAEDEGNLAWTLGSGSMWPRYTAGEFDAEGECIVQPVFIEWAANWKFTDGDDRAQQLPEGAVLGNGSVVVNPATPDRDWADKE